MYEYILRAHVLQLHNLLELIKKEQDVCNVAMSEVIRQVSVDCVERGALLAKIREQYAGLLAKVPPQIEGLHEELLAQRAVDRHLTEELIRFRTIVGVLTNELSELKMLENKNRREALRAQEEVWIPYWIWSWKPSFHVFSGPALWSGPGQTIYPGNALCSCKPQSKRPRRTRRSSTNTTSSTSCSASASRSSSARRLTSANSGAPQHTASL